MKHLIAISFITLFFSCSETGVIERHENGRIKSQVLSTSDSTQLLKRFDEKGNLVVEAQLSDSLKHGKTVVWDVNSNYRYELMFNRGRQNLNWKMFQNDKQIDWDTSVLFNCPDSIAVMTQLNCSAKINSMVNRSATVRAYFLCEPDHNGFLFSKGSNKIPRENCNLELETEEGSAIISFKIPSPGTRTYGFMIAEQLVDDIYLPYYSKLVISGK